MVKMMPSDELHEGFKGLGLNPPIIIPLSRRIIKRRLL